MGGMTKGLEVHVALVTWLQGVLPGVTVIGLDNDAAAPERVPGTGLVVVRYGDPGEATVDMSPPTYNYSHEFPLEIAARKTDAITSAEALDALLEDIADAVEADRFLGGVVDYLDAKAGVTGDLTINGTEPARASYPSIVADYATSKAL